MTINVANNPDGTYTVVCGSEVAIVGMPRKMRRAKNKEPSNRSTHALVHTSLFTLPPVSPSGGGVVAHIIDNGDKPSRGTRVKNTAEILKHLRVASTAARTAGPDATPRLLEFSLPGYHSIDVGKIRSTVGKAGQGNLGARIFVGKIK